MQDAENVVSIDSDDDTPLAVLYGKRAPLSAKDDAILQIVMQAARDVIKEHATGSGARFSKEDKRTKNSETSRNGKPNAYGAASKVSKAPASPLEESGDSSDNQSTDDNGHSDVCNCIVCEDNPMSTANQDSMCEKCYEKSAK
jgi:hypothetical protein